MEKKYEIGKMDKSLVGNGTVAQPSKIPYDKVKDGKNRKNLLNTLIFENFIRLQALEEYGVE